MKKAVFIDVDGTLYKAHDLSLTDSVKEKGQGLMQHSSTPADFCDNPAVILCLKAFLSNISRRLCSSIF